MSTMYEKYITWKRYSIQELADSRGYDSELDKACFDAQQALEFLMKAILIEYNIPFEKTHDIEFLSSLIEKTDIVFDKKEELDLLASTITSWEEKGRYYEGVKTKKETVKRVYGIMEALDHAFLKKQQENQDS